jgi:hypothetical protein
MTIILMESDMLHDFGISLDVLCKKYIWCLKTPTSEASSSESVISEALSRMSRWIKYVFILGECVSPCFSKAMSGQASLAISLTLFPKT